MIVSKCSFLLKKLKKISFNSKRPKPATHHLGQMPEDICQNLGTRFLIFMS
ncbi:hypothetical protein Bache_2128 [Bacteroides helcogenes P 36-108]|uniref:Uncharacterized protein n=1 Tax=Bacteroides helcogenes (strain ATCC 35417 / DSM 20613 / JCM 6297 / CCUG 15421 / P 36-108) TaxID=693979 RepID=E6SRJ4_BACT6|nr:hypothetical protein Bache_2128 [Bacteroides helcogenes P 36-108]